MNKNIVGISMLITMILVVGAMASPVVAQTEISYPVVELGNCVDKAACKTYCDKPANVDACLSFAEKNNLMSQEEIKAAKNFKKTGMTGPGGCKGKNECSTYCNGPDHMDACISFAEKNGMMSGDQLQEAKKVQGAIAKGIKPPACGSKDACNSYCSSKEHMSECVNFAESAGIISKEEADKIKSGGPGRQGQQSGPGGSAQSPDGQQGQNGQQGGPGGKGGGQGQGRGGGGNGGGGGRGQEQQGQGGQGPGGQGNGGGGRGPGDGSGGGQGPGGQGQGQGNGPGGGQGNGGPGGQDSGGGNGGGGGQGPGDGGSGR